MLRPAFAMVWEPRLYPPTAISFFEFAYNHIATGPANAHTVNDRIPTTMQAVAWPQDFAPS